jgi:hypothetical protein
MEILGIIDVWCMIIISKLRHNVEFHFYHHRDGPTISRLLHAVVLRVRVKCRKVTLVQFPNDNQGPLSVRETNMNLVINIKM